MKIGAMGRSKAAWLLIGALALIGASFRSYGDVIYQDNFSGAAGGLMNGRAPDIAANGVYGGTAGATWSATAAVTTNPDGLFTISGSNSATIIGTAAGADANLIENNRLPL